MQFLHKLFTDTPAKLQMLIYVGAAVIGGIGGYVYYAKVGCLTGSCAITGNPYISTLYGVIMALLLANIATSFISH